MKYVLVGHKDPVCPNYFLEATGHSNQLFFPGQNSERVNKQVRRI